MEIIKPKFTNYYPDSLTFMEGFLGPRGDVGFQMIADYEKAESILLNLKDSGRKIISASMGLDGDWEVNSTRIFDGENHFEYDCHGSSQWAEPLMIVSYEDGSNEAYSVWYKEGFKEMKA